MLHLIKLAVGARTVEDVAAWQAGRTKPGEAVTVTTRQFPRRAPELVDGGSLYWVVAGVMLIRQEIRAVDEIVRHDGTKGTAISVSPALVDLAPRRVRAFQGWRYLTVADAPADLDGPDRSGGDALPPALLRSLAELCLI